MFEIYSISHHNMRTT